MELSKKLNKIINNQKKEKKLSIFFCNTKAKYTSSENDDREDYKGRFIEHHHTLHL
ncbi:hypothetical protein MF1_04080 [Bartonella quintana]|nr:hypothetical protein MF1_04080 [Bartonella quintana]